MSPPAVSRAEVVTREDLLLFINACFAYTGQQAFYGAAEGTAVDFDFLHAYILGNYRRLYALTLAAGVAHFSQQKIIEGLLSTGRETPAEHRAEENALIAGALASLPPQRVYRLFEGLRRRGVNNRRTRASFRRWLAARPDPAFDAVKYRGKLKSIALYLHLPLGAETARFLYRGAQADRYETPLFETFRRAHHDRSALFELPFTVAEGLAKRRGIPREVFLAGIEGQLTAGERLRMSAAARREGVALGADLDRADPTRLALYALSLKGEERQRRLPELIRALGAASRRDAARLRLRLGRVAAVLDRSHSASGGTDTRRRPLAVAIAADALLREAASAYLPLWTPGWEGESLSMSAEGQTDLASPILRALEWGPELLVIVSDGVDNDPPGAAGELLSLYRQRLDPERRVSVVHLNPVVDALDYRPRALSPAIPTVALRDAGDLATALAFARLSDGTQPMAEVEASLAQRAAILMGRAGERP